MKRKTGLHLTMLLALMVFGAVPALAAPAPVLNVTALASSSVEGEVLLNWTAPDSADGFPSPSGYIVKYATSQINSADLYSAWVSTYSYNWTVFAASGEAQGLDLTGLTPGVTLYFAVVAVDTNGVNGAWSAGGAFNTANYALLYDTSPAMVGTLTFTTGNNVINISWPANTEIDLENYRVERSSYLADGYTEIAVVAAPGLTCQDINLINGNTYYYRVRAEDNTAHLGPFSAAQSTVPWISLPAPSFNLAYSQTLSTTAINWAWNSLPPGTSGYRILNSTSGLILKEAVTPSDTYWVQNYLTPNSSGTVLLQVFNGFETTNSAAGLTLHTFAVEPVNFSTTTIYTRAVGLAWSHGANASDTSYELERSSDGWSGYATFNLPAGATSYFDTALLEATTFSYRIRGVNGEGVTGADYSALTLLTLNVAPGAVTQLSALPGGTEGFIDLSWTSPGDDGPTGNISGGKFRVDYSTDSLKSFTTASYQLDIATSAVSPGDRNFITITGLNAGATYYFRVWTADELMNWSALSSGATTWAQYDVTSPSAISDLITAPFYRKVSLNWTSPGDDGDFGELVGSYEIRTSYAGPILTDTDWNTVPTVPPSDHYLNKIIISTTAAPGSLQSAVVTGLSNGITYYFAVRAADERGNQSAVYPVSCSAMPVDHPPSASYLTAPDDYSIKTSTPVRFTWSVSTDTDPGDSVTNYRVYFSTDSSFATLVDSQITNKTYLDEDLLSCENKTVYWRVAAYDLDNNFTLSTTSTVRINTANSPPGSFDLTDLTTGYITGTTTPVLTWNAPVDPDPGAVLTYQVDLSRDQNFTSVISSLSIPSTAYTEPPLTENSTYWWRVWASDGEFRVMSSATGYFRINAVSDTSLAFNLNFPSKGAVVASTTVNFSWAASVSPDPDTFSTYDLSWSQLANFSSSVTLSGLTLTTTSYPNFGDNGIYYWRVTARCSNGLSTPSSQTNKFYVDTAEETPGAFSLVQPGYGVIISTTLRPFLSWSNAVDPDPEDQVRYNLEISPRIDFTGAGTVSVNTGADNFYAPLSDLSDQTTYYWRVRAAGYQGSPSPVQMDTGTVSAVSVFNIFNTLSPPQNFALVSPANGAAITTRTPLLSWAKSVDTNTNSSLSYTVVISTAAGFTSTVQSAQGLTDTRYQVKPALPENQTYYWKVLAVDSNNLTTPCAGAFRFTVPVVNIPQVPMGLRGTLSADKLKFNIAWSPVNKNSDGSSIDDLASYNIYRGSDRGLALFASVTAGTAEWTDETMQGVEYFYRISAVNSSGIESVLEDSPLLDSRSLNTLTYVSDDRSLTIEVPDQVGQYLLAGHNQYARDLRIKFEHNPAAENDKTLSSYFIRVLTSDGSSIDRFNFDQPLTLKFGYSSGTFAGKRLSMSRVPAAQLGNLNIYWNNNIEYIRIGGTTSSADQQVVIKANRTGEYQLRRVSRAPAFAVASIYPPKVFTPNIAPYEKIIFYVDNPQGDKVTGKVFNLRGEFAADLAAAGDATSTSVILEWDGKDSNGGYVHKGVYIYQIEGSGKTINGTIMVAR